ncbi:MAG: hypothetical protein ACQETI_03745 [Halobacteriota archaeon]
MSQTGLSDVVESRQLNAALGWTLVVFLVVMAGAGALSGDVLWAGFTLVLAALALVPSVAYRELRAMLPWEVLALASFPVVGRVVVVGEVLGGIPLTGRVSAYLAVAAVALIIAVELDVFTPVRMNYSFAVLFVVITTMATAGVWAVVKWLSDQYLGTAFLLGRATPEEVEAALMWDFVAATVAGLFAGVLFEYYFRRRSRGHERVPDDLGGVP